ncbi:sensor domain-containing diguanylate cyclase [Agromyces silvae]|uniref:sensor domain-containing diguanylate cyclase n=1 Tax=Agromyces silvae TaxID=3388266 RepID=UPI00359F4E76
MELFEDAPCGLLETTPDGIITRVNRTFERWTGHTRESITGGAFAALLTPPAQQVYETRCVVVLSLTGEVREVALTARCADGRELPILVNAAAGTDGAARRIRVAVFDATDRQDYERQLLLARRDAEASEARVRVLQEQLEHEAMHDRLTGLANRARLQERLDEVLAGADRSGRPLSVVFLDLDGFKPINDRLGHRLGDRVLAEVAANLASVARASETVARYGGDEFVIVCEDADAAAGAVIAERFRAEARRPLESIPPTYAVSASVGVAAWEPARGAKPTADELLRVADEAMYASKEAGRDRVTVVSIGGVANPGS